MTSEPKVNFSVMTSVYFIVFMFCFTSSNGHLVTNNSNVEMFGDICPQLDSCKFPHSTSKRESALTMEQNCACDNLCSDYGDCCIDAPGNKMSDNRNEFKCLEIPTYGGVYMKDSCPSSYDGPNSIRLLCERTKLGDRRDPVGSLPMTDSLTGETYKNYYCSMCNGKHENMVLWTPKLDCTLLTFFNTSGNLTEEYILENIATDGRNWGVYLDDENGSSLFHECDIDVFMPSVVKNKIRLCKPYLVSDCPLTWNNDEIRTMCRSYMGAKFARGGRGYKNIHCAVCNQENVSNLSCQSGELEMVDIFRVFLSHSFTLLMDFGQNNGPDVGLVRMCNPGAVYDPFFKRCRSVTCLPGFVKRGRQCFPRYPIDIRRFSAATLKRGAANNGTTNHTTSKKSNVLLSFSDWRKLLQPTTTNSSTNIEQYTTLQAATLKTAL